MKFGDFLVLYHILGGKQAGLTPQFIRHEGQPHWFLKTHDGTVIDPTAAQFDTHVPYDEARGCGFLTREPSRRAKIVMNRISDAYATEPTQDSR